MGQGRESAVFGAPFSFGSSAHSSQVAQATTDKSSKSHQKRRRSRSYIRRFKDKCLKHTWLLPLLILVVLLAAYAVNPTESNPLHYAIFLSYPQPPKIPGGPVMYGKGKKDIAFVSFYTIVLSFTREFLMQRMIRPLAVYCGIRGKGKTARFMEQVYTAIYFAIFGPFGLYVMSRTNIWYFNTTAMFEGFPHREHDALFKSYYLLQASYWAQQAIVLLLQLEKPRKDFKELVGHHIITLALIGLSYRFHFTYIGLAVYITHDVSDFFLAVSSLISRPLGNPVSN
jgi:acyl-CoA-dependent ceramide synthase